MKKTGAANEDEAKLKVSLGQLCYALCFRYAHCLPLVLTNSLIYFIPNNPKIVYLRPKFAIFRTEPYVVTADAYPLSP
jgi:hypothetical protein